MSQSLTTLRQLAARHQHYRCYYCSLPMWCNDPQAYMRAYGVSAAQAKLLQCTAEHLIPKCIGGTNSKLNIVAACRYCNAKRHARRQPMEPIEYKRFVHQRITKGGWLAATLPKTLLGAL